MVNHFCHILFSIFLAEIVLGAVFNSKKSLSKSEEKALEIR
jgi:hypothetical protein